MRSSIFMLLIIALFSCNHSAKFETAEASDIQVSAHSNSPLPNDDVLSDPNAKRIRKANYRFRVNNVAKSTEIIENHVRKFPAHVSSSNLSFEGDLLENRMTIRVQSVHFTDLLKEIDKEAAYVHYRNIQTEDVTRQFVDLDSRLKTKREVQERYKEILRSQAGKIEELLAAEKQIGELQEEIEATVSKLNYLKDQVAYSTINIEFYEKVNHEMVAENNNPLLPKFGTAFMAGLNATVNVLIAITTLWPLFFFGGILFLILRRKKLFPVTRS